MTKNSSSGNTIVGKTRESARCVGQTRRQLSLIRHDGWATFAKRVICGCDSEESAKAAGYAAVKYYSGPAPENDVHIDGQHLPSFWYSVKEHEGEWI